MKCELDKSIAGFDSSLIEGILRNTFNYDGKIDELQREEGELAVRLYNDRGLDVSVVKKDCFRSRSIIVQTYRAQRNYRQIAEVTNGSRELSLVGYMTENRK